MSYQPSEGLATSENEKVANDRYGNGRFYPDDEIYVNKKNIDCTPRCSRGYGSFHSIYPGNQKNLSLCTYFIDSKKGCL